MFKSVKQLETTNIATIVSSIEEMKSFAKYECNINKRVMWNNVYYVLIKQSEPAIQNSELIYYLNDCDISAKPSIWSDVNGFTFKVEHS